MQCQAGHGRLRRIAEAVGKAGANGNICERPELAKPPSLRAGMAFAGEPLVEQPLTSEGEFADNEKLMTAAVGCPIGHHPAEFLHDRCPSLVPGL